VHAFCEQALKLKVDCSVRMPDTIKIAERIRIARMLQTEFCCLYQSTILVNGVC